MMVAYWLDDREPSSVDFPALIGAPAAKPLVFSAPLFHLQSSIAGSLSCLISEWRSYLFDCLKSFLSKTCLRPEEPPVPNHTLLSICILYVIKLGLIKIPDKDSCGGESSHEGAAGLLRHLDA